MHVVETFSRHQHVAETLDKMLNNVAIWSNFDFNLKVDVKYFER